MEPSGFTSSSSSTRRNEPLREFLTYFVLAAYIAITLMPLISSGYYADDLVNSTFRGTFELQGTTFFQNFAEVNREWIRSYGRLFPLGLLTGRSIIYLTDNLLLYKHVLLACVIASSMAFGYMVKIVTSDRDVSLLSLLLLPVFFQFRLYHSPILSYSGIVPIFVLLTMCSMIYYAKYLSGTNAKHLALSLFFYNITLYFSEISFPLIWLFWVLANEAHHGQTFQVKIRKVMPHLVSLALAVTLTVIAKVTRDPASAGYDGIETSFQFVRLVKTFLKQSYAMLPLSYYQGNPFPLFNHDIQAILSNVTAVDCITVISFAVLYVTITKRMNYTGDPNFLVYLGLPLAVFPAVLISLSSKYQQSLKGQVAGVGYIYVYIQYFGALLVTVGLVLFVLRRVTGTRWASAVHALILVVTSIALLLNNQNNRIVVDKANIDLHFQREALVRSLENRILQDIPDNSNLLILDEYVYDPYPGVESDLEFWSEGYPWINEALIFQHSGKRLRIYTGLQHPAQPEPGARQANDSGKAHYVLRIRSFPDHLKIKKGFVELAKIGDITTDASKKVRYQSHVLKTYLPKNTVYPVQDAQE